MGAYRAMAAAKEPHELARIRRALLEYCKLDTYAMVRIWQVFAGRKDLKL